MEFHPLANDYPLMPAYELGRLEEGMRERGYDPRFPVVLYHKKVLDGRNRWLAAEKAGVKPVVVTFEGTEEEARWFVQVANEERRHLTAEWLKRRREERISRVADARANGESLRTIAGKEGVSEKQVRNDLQAAVAEGYATEPPEGKVTTSDNKTRPARQPRPAPKSASKVERLGVESLKRLVDEGLVSEADGAKVAALEPVQQEKAAAHLANGLRVHEAIARAKEDPPEAPADLLDALGIPVPDESLAAFETAALIDEAASLIRKAERIVSDVAKAPGGEEVRRKCQLIERSGRQTFRLQALHNTLSDLRFARPHAARCPFCLEKGHARNRKDCNCCHGLPYVTELAMQSLPQECREAVESLKAAQGGGA